MPKKKQRHHHNHHHTIQAKNKVHEKSDQNVEHKIEKVQDSLQAHHLRGEETIQKQPITSFFHCGTKPQCMQSRWFNVFYDITGSSLLIHEYRYNFQTLKSAYIAEYNVGCPKGFSERIVGHPICIAAKNNILIIQYITQNCDSIQFFLVDCVNKFAVPFYDTRKYFKKNFTCAGPIECHICKCDITKFKLLFRLPTPLLTKRRSLIMYSEVSTGEEDKNITVSNLKEAFQTNIFQALASHPNRSIYYVATVGSLCEKVTLEVLETSSTAKACMTIVHKTKVQNICDIENGESVQFEQVSMGLCPGGDWLIVGITAKVTIPTSSTSEERFYLIMGVWHSETLEFLEEIITEIQFGSALQHLTEDLVKSVPVFLNGGQDVLMCSLKKNDHLSIVHCHRRLPVILNLQKLCRQTILCNCYMENVKYLKMPSKMKSYLLYS